MGNYQYLLYLDARDSFLAGDGTNVVDDLGKYDCEFLTASTSVDWPPSEVPKYCILTYSQSWLRTAMEPGESVN